MESKNTITYGAQRSCLQEQFTQILTHPDLKLLEKAKRALQRLAAEGVPTPIAEALQVNEPAPEYKATTHPDTAVAPPPALDDATPPVVSRIQVG